MPVQVALSHGLFALVDECDLQTLSEYRWYPYKSYRTYYAVGHKLRPPNRLKRVQMHVLIMGKQPKGMLIDHINGNGLDNRRANLRFATPTENSQNQRKRVECTSDFKGVDFDRYKLRWRARIFLNGECIYLGRYQHETDEARAYDNAARRLYGPLANLNFPFEKSTSLDEFCEFGLGRDVIDSKNDKISGRVT